MVQASYFSGGEDGTVVPAVYGTRDAYLSAIGLPLDVPMDLQIAFNYSGAGSGDAWLDASHARMSMAGGGVERAYVAIVDDRLAADWAQIGDIGPINDDVNEMLGDIYGRYGATTPEQQEAVRNVLFKYDERFGVLANREFVEAAVEKNNARRQGFFEGPVGRAILSVAASFIPGVGPYVSMMLNAGFQLSDGASFGQVIAGAAVSYFTQQYTADFGNYVAGAFGDSISPAVAEVIAAGARNLGNTAINQLMSGNGLDGEGLLLAAAAGGFGSFITNFVDGSDFGKVLDEQFGRGRAGDIIGRLGASAVDGKLSASDFVGAFAAGRADQVTTVEGADGTHVFVKTDTGMITRNPDGSITQLDEGDDGQVVATTYDSDGNRIVSADAFTGALANPVWRTATLSDALTDQLTGESLFTGLEDIFGLAAGSVSFDGFTPDFDGTLSLFGSVLGGASPLELAALQEGGYGLDATMTSFVPDDVAVDAPPPDLTSKTYTKDQNGLETWRDPDTGAIIKQRDANGAMLEVVGDRRVITDPQGKVVSVQGGTRGEALRQARDSGSGLVEWNGKLYTTVTEEDLVRQSGQSVKAFREFKATKGGTYADFQAEITANKWGVLAQGGVDTKYWQSQGFTPELVAVTYAVNGNDHRLATMKPNETVAVDSLALNIANNLANLPAGFGELYRSAVNGFTAFAQSQEINGQTMTFTELMGAGVNYLLNAGQSAAKRLVDNTDSTGEAVLVAVGGGFQAIINSFKGGVEALDSLGKPLTPQQAAVETLKLFGGIASVFGVTGLARGAVAGTAVTTEGLSAASNVTVRTLADAAGLLLPDNPGSVVKHMDFLSPGPQPTALANVDDVSARIAAVDLAVETKHFYDSFDSARDIATVLVGPLSDSLGVARGRASVYDLALRESLFDYQNVGGTVPRLSDGTWIFPVGTRPDGLEFIGFDAFAPSIVRHEAQHVLDYAAAALDPASPYLLRMEWPNSGSSLYKGFAYTELNGFGITAEELSRSYVFAMANGDVAGAANALKGYQSILGTYDGLMGRVEEVLGNAVSQPSRSLMAQTMTASPAVPKNSGFQVVEFQIIGPEGLPVKMSAEVQAGLTPAQMNDAVTEQMISGLNQLDAYVDFRAARAADLAALKQHYQQQVG
ncbi:MAG TPA: hypothetical protein VLC93_12240, partial [Myxococcota bacterium]|nr:hypothetical protein [Myxococcota bacterium]